MRRARRVTIKKVLGEYRPERTPTHDNYIERSEAGTCNGLIEPIANVTSEYVAGEIGILRRRTYWHRVSPFEDGLGDPLLGLERLRIWRAGLAEKITPASAADCERAHTPGENMEMPLPAARSQ